MRLAAAMVIVAVFAGGVLWGGRYLAHSAVRCLDNGVACALSWEHREIRRLTEMFDPARASQLIIENDFGSVEVAPGGAHVAVEAVVYARKDDPEAEARAAKVSLSGGRDTDDSYRIAVAAPTDRPRLRVDLVAKIPPGIALDLRLKSGAARVSGLEAPARISSGSGSIAVTGMTGPVTAHTGSGSIKVADVRADIDADTGSGAIRLQDIDGDVEASTGSGSVRAERVRGGLTVNTGSGSIKLTDIVGKTRADASSGSLALHGVRGSEISATTSSGSVRLTAVAGESIQAKTSSGSMAVTLTESFSGELDARTGSGSVRLLVPPGSDCELEASSGSGSVRSDLPLRDVSASRRHIRGTLGSGRGRVHVSTGSGSVRLEKPAPG